jgi:NADH:ubiquinone oxidoreductase subunit 6 (subunit J)
MMLNLFFLLSFLMVILAICTILVKNSFSAILYSLLFFFAAAFMLILINNEFLAFSMLLLYSTVISVLFIFSIFLIGAEGENFKISKFYIFIVSLSVVILSFEAYLLVSSNDFNLENKGFPKEDFQLFAAVLFNDYGFEIVITAIILFVAMIGSIMQAQDTMVDKNKLQKVLEQIKRSPKLEISFSTKKAEN